MPLIDKLFFSQAIGLPVFPPYWSLGYTLCRWGYTGIQDMNDTVTRNTQAGIPFVRTFLTNIRIS